MNTLLGDNLRMSLGSLRSSKTRSLMTVLGIVIGVAAVICAVSLGEGIRRQVATNTKAVGENVITVRPGKLINRTQQGDINSVNYLAALSPNTLTEQDYQNLTKLPDIETVVPLASVSGLPATREGRAYEATVMATTPEFPSVLQQKIAYGSFFGPAQAARPVAIVGQTVAERLFQENVPIGDIVVIRGQEFVVTGVFGAYDGDIFSGSGDLNRSIIIPFQTAKTIAGSNMALSQFFVKANAQKSDQVASSVTKKLKENHGGLIDFTVLKPGESITLANKTLNVATAFVAGIAAISLLVGGIGIMNIMFVGVMERTREIGIRKSLGATNKQIYSQFLVESTIISLVGGLLGILAALLGNFLLRVFSNLRPVTTLPIILLAALVSMAVGIIFGTVPAIKAARKDPIQALRYE